MAARNVAVLFLAALAAAIKFWQWDHWLISAYDGGLYMQSLWLAGHGLWNAFNFFSSQPNLADADQWILVPLGVVGRLGGPYAILAVQAVAVAGLGGAAWTYARDVGFAAGPAAAALVVAFLHPSVFGTHVLDWHPDPIGAAALAWALVLARRGAFRPFVLLTLVALLTKNQAAVPVAAAGAAFLVRGLNRSERARIPFGLAALGLAMVFLVGNERLTEWLGGRDLNVAADYRSLGGSVTSVMLSVAVHPGIIVERVAAHLDYWRVLLEPLGYLPLLAPLSALPGLAVMTANSLGDHPYLTVPFDQYSIWAAPFLIFASLDAAAALATRLSRAGKHAPFLKTALVALATLLSARSFLNATLPNEEWRLKPPAALPALRQAAAVIPPNAAVMGDAGTATAVSWRRYAGSWPFTDFGRFQDAVPRGTPIYVFAAPGKSFGGAVDRERAWLESLARGGSSVVFNRGGVVVLRIRR